MLLVVLSAPENWSPENKSQHTGLLKTEPMYWSPENRANVLVS